MDLIKKTKDELNYLVSLEKKEFRKIQEKRFLKYVHRVYNKSQFYREELKKHNILSKNDLPKKLEEINKLPILNKDLFLKWTNKNECLSNITCTMSTSGTTQKPTKINYTKKSTALGWGKLSIRAFHLMNIDLDKKGMMITAINKKTRESYASHINTLEVKKILGEKLIDQPIVEPIEQTLDKIIKNKIKWIGTVPSFYNSLIIEAKEKGINLKKLNLETSFFGGTDYLPKIKREAEKEFNSEILGFYVLTEICVAGCQVNKKNPFIKLDKDKYVLFSDYTIFEFLNNEDKPIKKGETGRIIATPLFMDGTPLIRYEIGDNVKFHGYVNNFPIISKIKRSKAINFGQGLFYLSEIDSMKANLKKKNIAEITGLQLIKIINKNNKLEKPIFKVETRNRLNNLEKIKLKKAIIKEFKKNKNMKILLEIGLGGGIDFPKVEFYNFKKLVPEGTFKFKSFIDKTK